VIEIILTPEEIEYAKELAADMGRLKRSITEGEGNLAGFMGEIATLKVYDARSIHTHDYDLILADGRTADVKSKRTSVKTPPLEGYDCSVAATSIHQKCDLYIFTRVIINNKIEKIPTGTVWVLGHLEKQLYLDDARFLFKGQWDGDNGFRVKANCYNMYINKLNKPVMKELI
jgi:hypothetical protein